MSKYTCYYTTRQSMYRDLAIRWSKWASTSSLTENELKGIAAFFKPIARRFGLITEFRDIGII
jgi:hypothetical protein